MDKTVYYVVRDKPGGPFFTNGILYKGKRLTKGRFIAVDDFGEEWDLHDDYFWVKIIKGKLTKVLYE